MEALRARLSAAELEQFDVYADGGVRRGTDVLKALALGAKGVGLGKPVTYSMCAYGQEGIEAMLRCLRAEFENAMRLVGCTSVSQVRPGVSIFGRASGLWPAHTSCRSPRANPEVCRSRPVAAALAQASRHRAPLVAPRARAV